MEGIRRGLVAREGVNGVSTDPTTGSMTIHYDSRRHDQDSILRFLDDLDVVTGAIGNLPSVGGSDGNNALAVAVEHLNEYVEQTLGIPLDLRLALPLAFASAGVWSIASEGLMIRAIPGPLLLWLAFDTFVKLHPTAGMRPVEAHRAAVAEQAQAA